jgi:hypothetical protein
MGKKYFLMLIFLIGFLTTNLNAQSVSKTDNPTHANNLSKAPLDGGVSILLVLGLLGGLMIINAQKIKKKQTQVPKMYNIFLSVFYNISRD